MKRHRPRLTLRTRLTMVYGALFLVAGTALLALTYVLVQQSLRSGGGAGGTNATPGQGLPGNVPAPPTSTGNETFDGLSAAEAVKITELHDRFTGDALESLLAQGALALVAVGLVAVGLGWVIAGRTLRPLQHITATARRVAETNLHERIAIDGPRDELHELADTFDAMLERLDDAFERLNHAFDGQRRFAANASHELRTPLTIARTLIEVAVEAPDASPDLHQLARQLLRVNLRHERLVDGMLALAKAESGVLHPEPVDLADCARYAADTASDDADSNGVRLITDLHPARTLGDRTLLDRLAHNLVQNAVRHNIRDGLVEFTTIEHNSHAELIISNTGRTIPASDIHRLFAPFHRDRSTETNGNGLGLSIVNAVVQAHNGTIHTSPREGGGLTIRVTLPGGGLSRDQSVQRYD